MPARMEFGFTFNTNTSGPAMQREPDSPMRILILGDFHGVSNTPADITRPDLIDRPIMSIDIDNFDKALSRISPRLNITAGDTTRHAITLTFKTLEDFHPDQLYNHLDLFQALRGLRTRLLNPQTSAQAVTELTQNTKPGEAEEEQYSSPTPETNPADDNSMFASLLGKQSVHSSGQNTAAQQTGLTHFIQQLVQPHIVPDADVQQYVSSVDIAISDQMRTILHHPDFQAMEALWRSVHGLVTGLETGEELKLYLLDISKQELMADIQDAGENLQHSQLHRLLVEKGVQMPGGEPWSLLVGNYTFGTDIEDINLLAAMGAIGSQAGGPFLAGAAPEILGCRSLVETPNPREWKPTDQEAEQRWQSIRKSNIAQWIGLALPRVILRLPYGEKTDETEQFQFEELTPQREHEHYLWGNPAFACALLMAQAFQERSWEMEPGDIRDIGDLPAHSYQIDGEWKITPGAEIYLTEGAAEKILGNGLMPLISIHNTNNARVLRFQSISDPNRMLAGAWV